MLAVLAIAGSIVVQAARADNPAVTVSVDANANRHAINPEVYGVAFASTTQLQDLNVPLNRYGGNSSTTYNWQQNADNRGSDWYFESIGDTSSTAGERGDTFLANTKAAGARALIALPMVDWVAKLGSGRSKLASFSIAKYGAQQANDSQWMPDAGNGVKTDGTNVTGNDPNDSCVASTSTLQQQWVQHIVSANGTAANGGAKYFIMDNEHALWHTTHRDIQPTGVNMDTIKSKIIDLAGKVKASDSTALVVGPEEWGWTGYFYSGYDAWYCGIHGWSSTPDKAAHGNMDYMPWLLQQLQQNNTSTGQRLLDVFSLHYYPQRGEYSNDTSTATQQIRNQTTRDLWDPNYVSQSWIGQSVQLIPRMKSWVNTYYPGTKIGITEYNWGAESHINGATTQADIYGILGRESVDLATRWTTPDASTPTYKAMKMYRNYDGSKSAFGDTSVSASVPNPDNVAAFASQRTSDSAMTVMVINKYLSANTPVTVSLANFSAGSTAQVWQLTSSNAITRLSDATVSGSSISLSVPAQSITLLVIPYAPLPSGWTSADIGGPTPAGSASASSGTYTVKGGGADIWGTSDQFQYCYASLSGDGYVQANCTAVQNTNGWAKAGVMIRDGTAANAMFANVCITPSNGIAFQYRTTTGGSAAQAQVTGQTVPKYLKVSRTGNSFSGYYSTNGTSWTQIGSAQTIAMASAAKAGLSVTSHAQGTLCTSTFNNVTVASTASYYVYQDALTTDWADWSWSATNNFACTSPVKNGADSISTTFTAAYAALSLHKGTPVSTAGYTSIKFWVNGGSSAKSLQFYLQATDSGSNSASVAYTAPANSWTQITIPLSSVGSPTTIQRINFQDATGAAQTVSYYDDICLAP